MKVNKQSENEIRFLLSEEDLKSREIDLDHLTYGSSQGRLLFSELLQLARDRYGFQSGNDPVTIEGIPFSSNDLLIVIRRTPTPDELDTRFSRFSRNPEDTDIPSQKDLIPAMLPLGTTARDVLDHDSSQDSQETAAVSEDSGNGRGPADASGNQTGKDPAKAPVRYFLFDSLDDLVRASQLIRPIFHGTSEVLTLKERNQLVLKVEKDPAEDLKAFNRICNQLSEFGSQIHTNLSQGSILEEHSDELLTGNAIQKLSLL